MRSSSRMNFMLDHGALGRSRARGGRGAGRRIAGFSVVELLVVIFVIFVILAIILPALARVRDTSRRTETQSLMNTLGQSVSSFLISERRAPGYFSAQEMGVADNETRGFSGMQNVMMDLAGRGAIVTANRNLPQGIVDVGPLATSAVRVNVNLIGVQTAGNKGYFTPQGRAWVAQTGQAGENQGRESNDDHRAFPELVDALGAPILAWQADESATRPVAATDDFARREYDPGNPQETSRFYWTSNSAFLIGGQIRVGRSGVLQEDALGPVSMLAGAVADASRAISMEGLLGNGASPANLGAAGVDTAEEVRPSAARGAIVFHSAGLDGVYLSGRDRGGRTSRRVGGAPVLDYGSHFFVPGTTGGQRWTDAQGGPTSLDPLRLWDDVVVSAN